MIRSWGKGRASVCEVLAERESIYRMLPQTTHENLNKDYDKYSIDPSSRYTKINFNSVGARQVRNLFDSDEDVKDIFLSIRDSRKCRKGKFELLHTIDETTVCLSANVASMIFLGKLRRFLYNFLFLSSFRNCDFILVQRATVKVGNHYPLIIGYIYQR